MLRFLAYLLGSVLVSVMAHGYLHARLVRDAALGGRVRTGARLALAAGAVSLPAGMLQLLFMREAPRALASPVMWLAFGWVGVLLFLLPLVAASDVARALIVRFAPARRRALAQLAAGAAAGAAAALALVAGRGAALAALRVRRVRVPLARLPAHASGYTVVQLTDLHVGPTLGRAFVEAVVARTNALAPDLVAITGDLVDGSVRELAFAVAPLAHLRARDGVYFVTGNHEYLSGAAEWVAHLATLGVRVLRNERVTVGADGAFDLAGIDDAAAHEWLPDHGADLAGALRGRDATRALVLLAHRPSAVHEAARAGVDLQLSGHTHGGQIAPLDRLEQWLSRFVAGLYRVGDTTLYVSAGTGYWGPPMRLGTQAEITRVELVADEWGRCLPVNKMGSVRERSSGMRGCATRFHRVNADG